MLGDEDVIVCKMHVRVLRMHKSGVAILQAIQLFQGVSEAEMFDFLQRLGLFNRI